jgi:hypothetical protein
MSLMLLLLVGDCSCPAGEPGCLPTISSPPPTAFDHHMISISAGLRGLALRSWSGTLALLNCTFIPRFDGNSIVRRRLRSSRALPAWESRLHD